MNILANRYLIPIIINHKHELFYNIFLLQINNDHKFVHLLHYQQILYLVIIILHCHDQLHHQLLLYYNVFWLYNLLYDELVMYNVIQR